MLKTLDAINVRITTHTPAVYIGACKYVNDNTIYLYSTDADRYVYLYGIK